MFYCGKTISWKGDTMIDLKKVLAVFLLALCFGNACVRLAEVKKEYYPSGKLKLETTYRDGKKDGIEKIYFESGKLRGETPYKDGKKEGKMRLYN